MQAEWNEKLLDTFHSELFDNLSSKLAKTWDDFAYKQFERHGYSKEEVDELIKQSRIQVIESCYSKVFCVDYESLFNIEIVESGLNEDSTKWITHCRCMDYKEPIKKGDINYENN